ncbi:cyclase family protein [Pleomorphovibrio marinus]|uniref:cyclase family protein n=1 Tax=Pleomorphovibrio marinus TaxID=2164132 RepID=UPI000E0B0D20|nr:cyclase family protein [Pleomorphovibrio marinus]
MNKRWNNRPENSTWGEWGEDDQLGRLNLIDQRKVLQGIAEVKVGKTFCLSLPLDYPGGQVLNKVRFPPVIKPVIRNDAPYFNYMWNRSNPEHKDIGSDDVVLLHTQYSTQWDSLAHRGKLFDINGDGNLKPVYYNGFRAGEDVAIDEKHETKAKALGIEHMATHGVQGRGVLVDLFSEYGEFPRKEVGYDDLMRIMERDDVEVEEGDILCLWTGLDQMIMRMQGEPDHSINKASAVLDGFDKKLLNWIIDSKVAAIASDNLAVEAVGKKLTPESNGTNLPIHELCLFRLGVHLGELWYLADLANWLRKHNRSKFLLTAPPLRLTGAVGSPVTPIATV